MRPLFALAAEYLREAMEEGTSAKQALKNINREGLFDAIIDREREARWRPHAPDDADLKKCENLLTLATFCGGLRKRDLLQVPEGLMEDGVLPMLTDFDKLKPVLARMGLNDANHLPPLQPDILGEHFVLRRLEALRVQEGEDIARQMRNAAWRLGAAEDAAGFFLLRAAADFFDRVIEQDLLAPDAGATKQAAVAFSRATVDLSHGLGEDYAQTAQKARQEGEPAPVVKRLAASLDTLFNHLAALREKFSDHADIALKQAQVAVNVTTLAGAAGAWDRVDAMLGLLAALRQEFPGHADIALEQAKAAVNVTSHAGKWGEWKYVDDMLERIDSLRAAFSCNENIALEEAKIIINIADSAAAAGE